MNEAIEKIAENYGETSTGIENLAKDIRELVDRTFLLGIKEGWEQSSPEHNSKTHKEIDKVIKDVFEGLNA